MHQPVLLQSVIEGLNLGPGLTVVDATINGAGHSFEISRLIPGGHLIGIDRDVEAVERARERLSNSPCKVSLAAGNFRDLDKIVNALGVTRIDRLLFDLGFSSDQLAVSDRGFSFQADEPLLMTYESEIEPGRLTAREIVNRWREERLTTICKDYGDEPFARRIARAIARARKTAPIETTGELVEIIRRAVPRWYRAASRRRHFATKVFQALRIAVNDEFGALVQGLTKGFTLLRPSGRLAVITFHSGEAKVVKIFFRDATARGAGLIITRRATRPTLIEIKTNPRARSATLRIIQKNDD